MAEVISGIYRITNQVNGRVYVGSSTNVAKRLKHHRLALGRGTHDNSHLQRAWNKYGAEAFAFVFVEAVERDQLLEKEQAQIDALMAEDRAYNISPTAGSNLGYKPTEETLRRLSESHKGIYPSAEALEKMRSSSTGRKRSAESIARSAAATRGLKRSDETRAKQRASQAKRWEDPDAHERMRQAKLGRPSGRKGFHHSEETKAKIKISSRREGEKRRGVKRDPSIGAKISAAKMGHEVTQETRDKISKTKRERFTDELRLRLSEAAKNRPPITQETRDKIGQASKGNQYGLGKHPSDEARALMRAAKLGKKKTPETRARMREAAKQREAAKRERRLAQEKQS